MWHYFWAHRIYHFTHLCPKHRTRRCPLVLFLILLTIITIIPQLWVIYIRDFYIMYCPFPIHSLMVTSVVFTTFMIGFSVLFVTMDPVMKLVKLAFHLFGVADFIFELIFIIYTFKAFVCILTATEMYIICMVMAVGSILTFIYFIVVVPLWICNKWVFKDAILNSRNNDGCCYDCVRTCPCLWHV